MAVRWKAVELYFTVVLFVFQFYPVCNFGKFDNFGFDIIRSERVKIILSRNALEAISH